MRVLPELIRELFSFLPHWAVAPVLALLVVAALPSWLHSVRLKQIRNRLRWVARAKSPEERAAHAEDAFSVAAGKGRRLVALADEALKLNQRDLFRRALADLKSTQQAPLDVARLETAVRPEATTYGHPVEAVVAIERLLEADLHDRARERLSEALARFPGDADLLELQERLRRESPSP